MAALVGQYIRESGLAGTNRPDVPSAGPEPASCPRLSLNGRTLARMRKPTVTPRPAAGRRPCQWGCGLSWTAIFSWARTLPSYADGKMKVELGDDPEKTGAYQFSFSIHNLTDRAEPMSCLPTFFTQAVFTENKTGYLDTQTAALDAAVEFSTGKTVTVPAGGETNIQVTVVLTDEQKKKLQADYPNGAYVEGLCICQKAKSRMTGMQGTEHSIPVLGFYGNWSDASMFDVGSRAWNIVMGLKTRYPLPGMTTMASVATVVAWWGKRGLRLFLAATLLCPMNAICRSATPSTV